MASVNPKLGVMLRDVLALSALVASLAACAQNAALPALASASVRVLVKLRAEAPADAIAAQASRSAGVPATYVAAASPQWHALTLACKPADCDAALQRLSADSIHFETVQRDSRQRVAVP